MASAPLPPRSSVAPIEAGAADDAASPASLDALLRRGDVWRGGADPAPAASVLPTGFPELDARLPGGGWPLGALTEILTPEPGRIGGLGPLLPALARLSREPRWLSWVAPPYLPYAPALAAAGIDLSRVLLVRPRGSVDGLWALEQVLGAGACSAVLAWPAVVGMTVLRRLQLSAERGGGWGVLFRPLRAAREPSPAPLRLQVEPTPVGVRIHWLKRRGRGPGEVLCLRDPALSV